jgi:hypothetical protein
MQIEGDDGPVTINESDFDKTSMKLFKEQTQLDISKMKVDELKVALNGLGVEYTDDDKKPALAAILQDALDAE